MRSIDPSTLGIPANPVALDAPSVHHLAGWEGMSHPQRLAALRAMVEQAGRDPRVRDAAIRILREANVEPRDYPGQVDALHRWVQTRIYYVNEPDEVFQDPLFTLDKQYGDCDDQQILLMALYESIALPWKFVISGYRRTWTGKREPFRYIEGTPFPPGSNGYDHIYGMVGYPPGEPTAWKFVEPTIPGVPAGWDVVAASIVRDATQKRPWVSGLGAAAPPTEASPSLFSTALVRDMAILAIGGMVSAVASQVALDWYREYKAGNRSNRRR
ncbi:MAG: transglutaminase family protein [Chloroflexi bacterium]|nr:transglutaminase family protein [Chloroflexota bacterium]